MTHWAITHTKGIVLNNVDWLDVNSTACSGACGCTQSISGRAPRRRVASSGGVHGRDTWLGRDAIQNVVHNAKCDLSLLGRTLNTGDIRGIVSHKLSHAS